MPNKKIWIAFHGTRKEIRDCLEKCILGEIDIIKSLASECANDKVLKEASPGDMGNIIWKSGWISDIVRAAKASAHIEAYIEVSERLSVPVTESFISWTDIILPQ